MVHIVLSILLMRVIVPTVGALNLYSNLTVDQMSRYVWRPASLNNVAGDPLQSQTANLPA